MEILKYSATESPHLKKKNNKKKNTNKQISLKYKQSKSLFTGLIFYIIKLLLIKIILKHFFYISI